MTPVGGNRGSAARAYWPWTGSAHGLAAVLIGALAGGLLVVHVNLTLPLAIAAALLVATGLVALRLSGDDDAWARPPAGR
jgi:hypothetical protein